MPLARFTFEADGVLIEGEGVVTVTTTAAPADLTAAILEFLDAQDPAEVEQAALNRQGWGSGKLTADILAVLRERAAVFAAQVQP